MTSFSNENFRIEIANEQSRPFNGERLVSAVTLILAEHGFRETELSIAVVDDQTIRELNKTYLNHDYETDVISFRLDDGDDSEFLSGQLIVSSDTAATLAQELSESSDHEIPMDDELLLYVVHGTLHLVGFNDKQPAQEAQMRKAEQECFEKLGVDYHWPPVDEDTE